MSLAERVFSITRPNSKLMTYYVIKSILTGPGVVISLPVLFFRYHTMQYRFDEEGISMKYGILFRREINLTYARIQDIHVASGPVLRWLGLAELHIQTASGSATPEMTIEGIPEFEMLREFLYTRMRGYKSAAKKIAPPPIAGEQQVAAPAATSATDAEMVTLLRSIREDIHAARVALESGGQRGGGDV